MGFLVSGGGFGWVGEGGGREGRGKRKGGRTVTGRITNTQEDEPVVFFGEGERGGGPELPGDGTGGVGEELGVGSVSCVEQEREEGGGLRRGCGFGAVGW